jgi:hypothetical protein
MDLGLEGKVLRWSLRRVKGWVSPAPQRLATSDLQDGDLRAGARTCLRPRREELLKRRCRRRLAVCPLISPIPGPSNDLVKRALAPILEASTSWYM